MPAKTSPADFAEVAISGLLALALVSAVLWAFNIPIQTGEGVLLVFLFFALSFGVRRSLDISVGFGVITLALLYLLANTILPTLIVRPFVNLLDRIEGIFGLAIFPKVGPVAFFVLAVTFVAVMIAIRLRVTGKRKFTRTIADSVLKEFGRYVDAYLNVGRLVILFSFGAVVLTLRQSVQLFGEIGNIAAEVPFVSANLFTGIVGFDALGGSVPIIEDIPLFGDLTPEGWLVLVVLVLGLAAATRWDSSGPLSRFLDR